jgi:hypothetical protein
LQNKYHNLRNKNFLQKFDQKLLKRADVRENVHGLEPNGLGLGSMVAFVNINLE